MRPLGSYWAKAFSPVGYLAAESEVQVKRKTFQIIILPEPLQFLIYSLSTIILCLPWLSGFLKKKNFFWLTTGLIPMPNLSQHGYDARVRLRIPTVYCNSTWEMPQV